MPRCTRRQPLASPSHTAPSAPLRSPNLPHNPSRRSCTSRPPSASRNAAHSPNTPRPLTRLNLPKRCWTLDARTQSSYFRSSFRGSWCLLGPSQTLTSHQTLMHNISHMALSRGISPSCNYDAILSVLLNACLVERAKRGAGAEGFDICVAPCCACIRR